MLSAESRAHLERRIREGNVQDKVELEPEEYKQGVRYHQITGIFDGALEDEFIVGGLHEVNVADWLAESYAESAERLRGELPYTSPGVYYEVHVYEYNLTIDGEGDEFSVGDRTYRVEG